MDQVLQAQQLKDLPQRVVRERQLAGPRSLADDGLINPIKLERPPWGWQGHLVEDVVDVALQGQRWWLLGGHCLVELDQELLAGLHEGQRGNEAYALGDIERVPADVIGVVVLELGEGRGITLINAAGQGVHAAGGGRTDTAILLCIVHLVQCLHGCADLLAGDLLVEGEHKAVGAGAILPGDDERVQLWVPVICLRPEGQPLGHTQLRKEKRNRQSYIRHDFVLLFLLYRHILCICCITTSHLPFRHKKYPRTNSLKLMLLKRET